MSTQPNAAVGSSITADPVVADPEIVDQPIANDPASSTETEVVDETIDNQPEPTLTETDGPADERKLPNYVKALKEADPKGFAKAKTEFFDLAARRSVHPTVQAAREEHELVTQFGGREGISKLREDGQYFKTAAQQFLKGDPAFVKDLFDEDPIAAELHVPHFLEAYRTKNFDGYKTTLAQLWDTEFKNVGFDNAFEFLESAITAGEKDKALGALKSFRDWKTSISETARRGPSPREKALLAERAKQHETREQSERDDFHKSYRTDALNQVVEDGSKVFDSFFKGRKIDAEDRTDLLREAFAFANRAVQGDKQFVEQRDAHLAAGDAAAALKLSRARFAKEMPEAVKRVARRYGMIAGPAKPTPTGDKPNQPGAQPAAGFVRVNARPNPDDIDRAKSTREMLQAGRAILKNGRKIDWAHLRAA